MYCFLSKLLLLLSLTNICLAKDDHWGIYLGRSLSVEQDSLAQENQVFIPIERADGVVFIDLRQSRNNQGQTNISLGTGTRRSISQGQAMVGINSFIDTSYTQQNLWHVQSGLGLEFLSDRVDIRFNLYAPISQAQTIAGSQVAPYARLTQDGHFEIISKSADEQRALPGGDFTTTLRFPITENLLFDFTTGVFLYVGGQGHQSNAGAMASLGLEAALNVLGQSPVVRAEVGVRQDSQNGPSIYGNLSLRVGLNTRADRQAARRSPQRRSSIYTSTRVSEVEVAQGSTVVNGHTYNQLFKFSAKDDVVQAIAEAGENSLVLLSGEEGMIHITSGIELSDGQSILGSGRAFLINGPSQEQAVLIVDAPRAQINQNNASEAVFTVDHNTLIANLDIQGGNEGILVDNKANVKIIDVNISDVQTAGISVNESQNISISNTTLSDSAADGLVFRRSHEISLSDIDFENISQENYVIESTHFSEGSGIVLTGNQLTLRAAKQNGGVGGSQFYDTTVYFDQDYDFSLPTIIPAQGNAGNGQKLYIRFNDSIDCVYYSHATTQYRNPRCFINATRAPGNPLGFSGGTEVASDQVTGVKKIEMQVNGASGNGVVTTASIELGIL